MKGTLLFVLALAVTPHREGDPSDGMRGSAEGVGGCFGRCGSWIARYSLSES